MLKQWLLIGLLFCFFPLVSADLTVERSIDGTVQADGTIDVLLSLKLRDANVDSVIITEQIPDGWTLIDSSPLANDFGNGKFKWLIYDNPLRDKTISYTLQAPPDLDVAGLVSGNWRTLEQIGFIEGDALLQPRAVVVEPVSNPPSEEPTTLPAPDYTFTILTGFVLVVLAVLVAFVVLRKKPQAKENK